MCVTLTFDQQAKVLAKTKRRSIKRDRSIASRRRRLKSAFRLRRALTRWRLLAFKVGEVMRHKRIAGVLATGCTILIGGFVFAFAQTSTAATLDVDLVVSHGVYISGERESCSNVVYLVIDRSGSMSEKSLPGDRTPNEALLESLKLQLDAIPLGTEIHVLPFSSRVYDETVFPSLDEKTRKAILNLVTGSVPSGQTLLYDAQDRSLTAAIKIMEGDATAEVRVLVYTDGIHQTPVDYDGEYKASAHCMTTKLGRKRFADNPNYHEELAAARKKFEEKFRDLFAKPNFEVEYEWFSASPKPEPEMRTKAPIAIELASHTPELYNPHENPIQAFNGSLHLPISDKCWDEVKGKPFTVEWTVGGKSATGSLKLDSGHQKCTIEWPSLPEDNPEPATLLARELPVGRKFELKDSKPVSYPISALKRAEVAIDSPAEGAVFVVGDKVKFAAKSSEDSVSWKFPSAVADGLSFDKTFDKEGVVKFSVTAGKGVRATTVSQEIEIIKTGVELKESANGYHETGKSSTFTAVAVGKVLGYEWTIDGQAVAGSAKAFSHVFKDTDAHEIGVTVRYKKGITASAKRSVRVWPTPAIRIEQPEEYDGDSESAKLRAGSKIGLKAAVEGAFETAVWEFEQDGKIVAKVPASIKDGVAAGSHAPAKGGFYDVTVTAEGLAGKISEVVQIYVKPKTR